MISPECAVVDTYRYMKPILLAGVMFLLASFQIAANDTLTVQNETNDPVRFAFAPADRVPELPVSESSLEDLIGELSDDSALLAPRGVRKVAAPSFDNPVLLGYVRSENRDSYTVVRHLVDKENTFIWIDEQSVVTDEHSAPLHIPASLAPSDTAPVAVDNRYSDWVDVPDLAAFRRDFRPEGFTRITSGSETREEITDSLLWQRGGTQLERIRALVWHEDVYLMASMLTPVSQNYSLLLRVFGDRAEDSRNEITVEIPAEDIAGPVLLWLPDRQQPRVVGEFARSRFLLEARISPDMIPADAIGVDPETLSIDIGSSLADAGVREEFHHTSVLFRNIPRVHGP